MTKQTIPFLDLVTPHRELEEELVRAFREAVGSARFIGGPEVEAFEQEFAAYCGTRFSVGVNSGTDALRFALLAVGVGQGDAVVTVSHTFLATVEAINQTGAVTEFVDVDERTCTMSARALAEYLEACPKDERTGRSLGIRSGRPIKAIVPVHLYGHVAEMSPILQLARRYDLAVVEDACQAHGAEYLDADSGERGLRPAGDPAGRWRRAGSIGRAAAFSFYPGKNLGACGEAGAVTTSDETVATHVRMLRDHGQAAKYYHDIEGYNGRLDAIQAAFLRIKLRRLDEWNGSRRDAARRYDSMLRETVPEVVAPIEAAWSRSVFHLYVVRINDRDGLARHLKSLGIDTGLHYPVPVHLQKCYHSWSPGKGSLPVTERLATEILSLPMFPGLTAEQQRKVVDGIAAFVGVGAAG
jgi:dTDP-4-amino-4,6-dideoxygalactose transaminase